MEKNDPIVIVGYARTPIGSMLGVFADVPSPELGGNAISAAYRNANLAPNQIQEVNMGCVLSAAVGQAPARQAALAAQLQQSTNAATISKVCGSGMKAIMLSHDTLLANSEEIQVSIAGGMENMSRAPYLLNKGRSGYRLGDAEIYDHMFLDGLQDAYNESKLMGVYADETATELKITRKEQDEFTLRSLEMAQTATKNGIFADEISPISIKLKKETVDITEDEIPSQARTDKIPLLKPAFNADGTVTAANSSSIADGAAALTLMRESTAKKLGLKPIAKILGHASASQAPEWFTTAPVTAIKNLYAKTGIKQDQVDLFEINEAFAVVTLAAIRELNLDINKVNIYGGACALGHPIGASGARIVCTLLTALKRENKKLGVASLCIGGGEAVSLAVELF